jgi:nicotinate dehydrogenase medium molybdopterin subunit
VEVDIETGMVRVVRATTAIDCGFPINPRLVEGQIDGQVSMAQGHALSEEVLLREGRVINPSFLEYKIPCALDMVETEQIHVTTEKYIKGQTFNSKEVGEGHVAGFLAAVANAVYDATGVRVKELPIYPHKIIGGLDQEE